MLKRSSVQQNWKRIECRQTVSWTSTTGRLHLAARNTREYSLLTRQKAAGYCYQGIPSTPASSPSLVAATARGCPWPGVPAPSLNWATTCSRVEHSHVLRRPIITFTINNWIFVVNNPSNDLLIVKTWCTYIGIFIWVLSVWGTLEVGWKKNLTMVT